MCTALKNRILTCALQQKLRSICTTYEYSLAGWDAMIYNVILFWEVEPVSMFYKGDPDGLGDQL